MGQVHCQKLSCKENETSYSANPEVIPIIKMHSASRIGRALTKTSCQDKVYYYEEFAEACHYAAVLDGFGVFGREVAEAIGNIMLNLIMIHKRKLECKKSDQDVQSIIKEITNEAEIQLRRARIDCKKSGACYLGLLILKTRYYTINIGNCKALVARGDHSTAVSAELNCTQDVTNIKEKQRISNFISKIGKSYIDGGEVGADRFWIGNSEPGLKHTRAFGAFEYRHILIPEPEINAYEISLEDRHIILGTDGLWDVMTSSDVAQLVFAQAGNDSINPAEALVKEAYLRWDRISKKPKKDFIGIGDDPDAQTGADDIGVVIVDLNFETATGNEN